MEIDPFLHNHRDEIILGALILAGLTHLGFFWKTLPFAEEYTKYVYFAITAAAGYTYYTFTYGRSFGKMPEHHRTRVPIRNVSAPKSDVLQRFRQS